MPLSFDRRSKTVFEEALEPTPSPKRYGTRLLAYAAGVVNIGSKKDIFHLTLEQELDPSRRGYFLHYHRGFQEPLFAISMYDPKSSEQFNDLKTAWKMFRKETELYALKMVYRNKSK